MHGSSEKSRVRTADGITRATPVAKLLPGVSVRVEVIDNLPRLP
jgi:hypothetical protein